ncbi:FadR/GntR family transcriptional regulator [Zafaria sp. Z1313]|uniref:FadR/GntR family transcriptional regulator n=1 Tax=Zafaria sp. Z1313 TaxID=3423202 RepID=UPI003D3018CB
MASNLTTRLVETLRARIVEGEIAPGDKLPSESTLIAEHGVSRTVVREAISRLQVEGLVHTRRGSGSFALTPPPEPGASGTRPARSLEERLELLAYRAAIESETAGLAARRSTEAGLQALRLELEAFDAAADSPSDALAHDFAFHRGIAAAAGNAYLLDAVDALGAQMIAMPRQRLEGAPTGGRPPAAGRTVGPADGPATRHASVASEHAAILAALEEGDAAAAAAAMRTHLANSGRRLKGSSGL